MPVATEVRAKYEAIIGLEAHVQLLTKSKIFCSCSTHFGDPPNTHVCPVCLGLPGALPVLNREAVTMAMKAAMALKCAINARSRFARNNYFYLICPRVIKSRNTMSRFLRTAGLRLRWTGCESASASLACI